MSAEEPRRIEINQEDPRRTEHGRDFHIELYHSENHSTSIRLTEEEADTLQTKMADELDRRHWEKLSVLADELDEAARTLPEFSLRETAERVAQILKGEKP